MAFACGDTISDLFPVVIGVRQGCVLAPTLFSTCMDWILGRLLERSSCGASFGNVKISDLDFVDDAVIFAETQDILFGAPEVSLSSAACGCWLHHWLGHGYAADAVSPLPVHWYSLCRPQKDDRLSQPPGVLIQWPNGARTQDPRIPVGSQAATLTTKPTPGLIY